MVMKLYPKSLGKNQDNYNEFLEVRKGAMEINKEVIKSLLEKGNKSLPKPTQEKYCRMCAIKDICVSFK
jgi:CRISPR/Cas system-associated exonuclease Cas4 (RecB family)